MVSSNDTEGLISDVRLSSVVPSAVTAENTVHELRNMDLAMKLHYLKGVYFFNREAAEGLHILDLKKPMFQLLGLYFFVAGRVRRSEDGRPLIKCNDSGVRIAERRANKTMDEWLGLNDPSLDDQLTYGHVLGPDLGFSPLVFIQFTWFKCGGLALGLRWAHVLGDAFSASTFVNMWGQIMAGHVPTQTPHPQNMNKKFQFPSSIPEKPYSLKRVESVGDYWEAPNKCKMESHSIHVTPEQLDQLLSTIRGLGHEVKVEPFQALCAIIWKSLAKIRGESHSGIVTLCSNDGKETEDGIVSNNQCINTVQAHFKVADASVSQLVKLIAKKGIDERGIIEEFMEKENEESDFIVYGAKLTFVNLEHAKIYELKLAGHKPVFASYSVMGVGDEGVILVLPAPENGKDGGRRGRIVTVILPESQVMELKNELKMEWGVL